jgi:hypothetical protein
MFLCAVVLSVGLYAQDDQTFPVEDVTSGPISFSGSLHFVSNSRGFVQQGAVKGINTSKREIIAVFARVDTPIVHFHYTHDFFSKSHGLSPGESFLIDLNGNEGGAPYTPITQAMTAKASLVFVQFADGSIWGDSAFANKLNANRQGMETVFRKLLDIYQHQGEKAFVAALEGHESGMSQAIKEHMPSNPDASALHLLDYYNQFGAAATITNIQDRLNAIAIRKGSGKF